MSVTINTSVAGGGTSSSSSLGTMTWAALQAAYPNGGAALLALPAGSHAFISDWGVPFFPALGNTAWKTAGPLTLLSITTDTTAILNSTTNFQAALTWTPPLKLLIPGSVLEIAYRAKQASGTAKPRAQCQISGVASALAQTSGAFTAAYTRGRWRADVRVAEVLRFNSGGNAERDQNRSEGSSLTLDVATAFSGSNGLEIGFSSWSTTASDSTFVFEQLAIVLHPSA